MAKKKTKKPSKKNSRENFEEAQLWHKERNGVRCDLCALKCFVSKDKLGACGLRKNVGNKMLTSNNAVKAMVVDTVEKRPLFHFHPNASSLSISGDAQSGWYVEHDRLPKLGRNPTPEQVVRLAEKEGVDVISYTYAEPTLFFEFIHKVAKLAHRSSIKNVMSTNGSITEEAIKRVARFLDAVVVNLSASGDPNFMSSHHVLKDPAPVMEALKQLKKQRVHLEVTDTVIPQIGDSLESCRKLSEHIVAELAPTVPFHVLQFHPTESFLDLPFTPVSTLEACAGVANRSGLRYVYIGNLIEPHEAENTFCYNCRELLIQRVSGNLKKNNLHKDRCPNCGVKIDMVV